MLIRTMCRGVLSLVMMTHYKSHFSHEVERSCIKESSALEKIIRRSLDQTCRFGGMTVEEKCHASIASAIVRASTAFNNILIRRSLDSSARCTSERDDIITINDNKKVIRRSLDVFAGQKRGMTCTKNTSLVLENLERIIDMIRLAIFDGGCHA